MSDEFENHAKSITSPGFKHFSLSAAPGVEVDPRPRSIYCNAPGSITIRDEAGVDLPYSMAAGQLLVFRGVSIEAITGGTFYGWT